MAFDAIEAIIVLLTRTLVGNGCVISVLLLVHRSILGYYRGAAVPLKELMCS